MSIQTDNLRQLADFCDKENKTLEQVAHELNDSLNTIGSLIIDTFYEAFDPKIWQPILKQIKKPRRALHVKYRRQF